MLKSRTLSAQLNKHLCCVQDHHPFFHLLLLFLHLLSLSRTRSLTLELKAEALRGKGKLLPYPLDCQIYCSSDGERSRAVANCARLCFPLTLPPFRQLNSAFSTTVERQKGSRFENNWRAFTQTVRNISSSLNGKRYTCPYGLPRMAAPVLRSLL